MRVLVTGGAGFIGVNLVRALLAHGDDVRVIDSLVSNVPHGLDDLDIDLRVGDIRDESMVARALEGIDAVIHLAAQTGVPASVARPSEDFVVNAAGTFTLLEACRHAQVRRFVFGSSLAPLSGSPPPVTEVSPVKPRSPYGASKAAAEAYCYAYFSTFGIDTVVLRFANVYGPWSTAKTSVVASLIRCGLSGERLPVHGDGRQTRDFIHVDDLVRAVLAAANSDDACGETLHVATGTETPIIDVAHTVCEGLGVPLSAIALMPARDGEPIRSVTSPARTSRVLGWQPQVGWKEGVARTCQWFLSTSAARSTFSRPGTD